MTEIALDRAVAWIEGGNVLAYPTETVWGLAADARSDAAVARLRAFKGRGDDAPISILVLGLDALAPLGFRLDAAAERLAREFWPGPLTLVLPCRARFAADLARADGAVGVRCSPHPVASELARRCAESGVGPITATSCNRSGQPAARTRDDAGRVCGGADGIGILASGEDARGELPSTVVDLTGARPRVLRWGALGERSLAPVLREVAA